ncbi:MAG: NADH:flavin oxidoreductase [Mobilitalea sp.]
MKYLTEPLQKGKLFLKNRLVMPPMSTSYCGKDGSVSNELLDYYDEKSQGGYLSLIIVEHGFITQQGRIRERMISVADDCCIDGLKTLANTIHKNGTMAVMQINHGGSAANPEVTGLDSVSASALVNPFRPESSIPTALSFEEINHIIDEFSYAANRIKLSGFDGVEIHAAHGYLLNQFFSPLTNHRTDEYGGSISGRMKILLEVIKAVRIAVGEEFPILLRLGTCDYMEEGTTIEDCQITAAELEKSGVDILDISGGLGGPRRPGHTEQGYFSLLSEGVKKVVSMPVILTGGIIDAEAAETLLAEEKADLIGVGTAIRKDSSWAKKAIQL